MSRNNLSSLLLLAGMTFLLAACGDFEDPTLDESFDAETAAAPPERAPVEPDANRNLLWGDLHVHSAFSYDAYTMGVRALPDDAYTYMKGGEIEHAMGYPIRAKRPLDFGAVTDHAEYLGVPRHLAKGGDSNSEALRRAFRSGSRLRATLHFFRITLLQMGSRETSKRASPSRRF